MVRVWNVVLAVVHTLHLAGAEVDDGVATSMELAATLPEAQRSGDGLDDGELLREQELDLELGLAEVSTEDVFLLPALLDVVLLFFRENACNRRRVLDVGDGNGWRSHGYRFCRARGPTGTCPSKPA